MEYALADQQHLKGLVISNMMSSSRLYNGYAHDVLMPAMDQDGAGRDQALEAEGPDRRPTRTRSC